MKNKAEADGKRFVYLATAISALEGMLFGYDIGVISYVIDYAFAGSQAWRWMFALAVIPAAAFGIGLVFIPDSPRWLAARGHADQARAVLNRIRGPEQAEGELNEIRRSVAQQKGHWSELLSPLLRPAMSVGVGLAIAQQITGINTVIYYAPTIFKFAGWSSAAVAILASIGAWLFAFFRVPETRGRSLEEIEAHWRAGKHPRAL